MRYSRVNRQMKATAFAIASQVDQTDPLDRGISQLRLPSCFTWSAESLTPLALTAIDPRMLTKVDPYSCCTIVGTAKIPQHLLAKEINII
jgi:hypothetical protein